MRKVTLQSIIKDAERSIATVDRLFLDTAHWNRLHPDELPVDPDLDGEMAQAKRYSQALIRECRRPRKLGEPIVVPVPLPRSVAERMESPR